MRKRVHWRMRSLCLGPFYVLGYIFRYDGSEYAHDDGDTRLMKVRYFFVFDDVRSKHIDDENYNEDKCFDVESLGRHSKEIL